MTSQRHSLWGPALAGRLQTVCAATVAVALAGCASGPPAPEWQGNAHAAVARATAAELAGLGKIAAAEWALARREAARTAQAVPLARVALSRCAVVQAALDLSPCDDFLSLAADTSLAEQTYHRWLQGQATAADAVSLPAAYRPLATVTSTPATEVLRAIPDPLSRLVAASVLWRQQRLDAEGLALAVNTASEQGWRRPLLAWLELQRRVAEAAGDSVVAEQASRRLDWLAQSSR